MEKRKCFKCGQEKVAIGNKGDLNFVAEMVMLTYGKHRNQFQCKNCQEVKK